MNDSVNGTGIKSLSGLEELIKRKSSEFEAERERLNGIAEELFHKLIQTINTKEGNTFIQEFVTKFTSLLSGCDALTQGQLSAAYDTAKDYAENNDATIGSFDPRMVRKLNPEIPSANMDKVELDDQGIEDLIVEFAKLGNDTNTVYNDTLKNNHENMTEDLQREFDNASMEINRKVDEKINENIDDLLNNLHVAGDKAKELKARAIARARDLSSLI